MSISKTTALQAGQPSPLGTSKQGNGVNFAIFSQHATQVRLEFYGSPDSSVPQRVIDLDSNINRTGDVWHVLVQGIKPGQLYAYRMGGPYDPKAGHRFNFKKLLLDPYAQAISSRSKWDFDPCVGYSPAMNGGDLVPSSIDDAAAMPKCVVPDGNFDWKGDIAPRLPWSKTIIYETHLRGITVHPSSGVKAPGTYQGLIEKIPYLKELGVTTVELLPVFEFNDSQVTSILGKSLRNYWGYDPVLFMAPKASYSSLQGLGQQKQEFREMIKAFHKASIEIVLDVVFNHTAETDLFGPTLNFRGIDNSIYYLLDNDKSIYKNFSGTGNTINANHPLVQEHILSALRYWVKEMHVDGFRFDLASILSRDCNGSLLDDAPILKKIAQDPVLQEVKIIAEPWDAAGAYQVGNFSDRRWVEWNDRYRDEVRRFWRGDDGMIGVFASRICGSADIFTKSGKGPQNSINFITCHDGFTLNDLVSYSYKQNDLNLQNNKDGANENYSYNYGVEGPSADAKIESTRKRQIKNYLLTLFISRGVPMLLGGDEFRRTQGGNNNAYCQDNETNWYDWSFLKKHQEIFNFTQLMAAFRRQHPALSKEQFYSDVEIQWLNPQGGVPNWTNAQEKQCACLVHEDDKHSLLMIFNAGFGPVNFNVPAPKPRTSWYLCVDTSQDPGGDIFALGKEPVLKDIQSYNVNPRSSVILLSR